MVLYVQDHFTLACVQSATYECKSLVLALAYVGRYVYLCYVSYDAIPSFISCTCPDVLLLPLQAHIFTSNTHPFLFPHRYLTLEQVKAASRLEEEFQLEIWGVVEGGHDMDRLNNSVNLSSVGVFMSLYYDEQRMKKMHAMWKTISAK